MVNEYLRRSGVSAGQSRADGQGERLLGWSLFSTTISFQSTFQTTMLRWWLTLLSGYHQTSVYSSFNQSCNTQWTYGTLNTLPGHVQSIQDFQSSYQQLPIRSCYTYGPLPILSIVPASAPVFTSAFYLLSWFLVSGSVSWGVTFRGRTTNLLSIYIVIRREWCGHWSYWLLTPQTRELGWTFSWFYGGSDGSMINRGSGPRTINRSRNISLLLLTFSGLYRRWSRVKWNPVVLAAVKIMNCLIKVAVANLK